MTPDRFLMELKFMGGPAAFTVPEDFTTVIELYRVAFLEIMGRSAEESAGCHRLMKSTKKTMRPVSPRLFMYETNGWMSGAIVCSLRPLGSGSSVSHMWLIETIVASWSRPR